MSGAHQWMHGQRDTAPKGPRAICKQSAISLETPLLDAENKPVSNGQPLP
jgi:hypothetical protein